MQRRTPWAGALALAAMLLGGCSSSDDEMFVAQLSGAKEVPPVNSGATGTAGFTIQGGTIHYSISITGTDRVIGAHIHSGSSNTNGGIRVVLFPGPGQPPFGDPTGRLDGFLASGFFTASDLDGITFDALVDAMRTGQVYVNVHNQDFRGGVVRGQIEPVR